MFAALPYFAIFADRPFLVGPGFTGRTCQTDIGECDSQPCQHGATCTEPKPNIYVCDCVPGYTGDNCETNIDDCVGVTCPPGRRCVDSINSFR